MTKYTLDNTEILIMAHIDAGKLLQQKELYYGQKSQNREVHDGAATMIDGARTRKRNYNNFSSYHMFLERSQN